MKLINIVLPSIILATIPPMTLSALENCCNSLDDDGDGAIDAADTDCQWGQVSLSAGSNSVCWATPSPYPNNARYTFPTYRCPSDYYVSSVKLRGETERR